MLKDLRVANITNLFWDNGSYLKPSTIPDFNTFKEAFNYIPTLITRYAGWVILNDRVNYAYYRGSYYFLQEIQVLDRDAPKIKYALIRDEWAEVITKEVRIKGTVKKTNDPALLLENIDLTRPLITEPASLSILKIKEAEFKTEIIEPIDWEVPKEKIIIKDDLEEFTRVIAKKSNESVLIQAKLTPRESESWQTKLIPYIKKLIEDFKSDKYQLGKVDIIHNTDIPKTTWTLTNKTSSISSQAINTHLLDTLDLSGLNLSQVRELKLNRHNEQVKPNQKVEEINLKAPKEIFDVDISVNEAKEGDYVYLNRPGDSDIFKVSEGKLVEVLFDLQKDQWLNQAKNPTTELYKNLINLNNALALTHYKTENNIRYWNDFIKQHAPEFVYQDLLFELPKKDNDYDYEEIYNLAFGEYYKDSIIGGEFASAIATLGIGVLWTPIYYVYAFKPLGGGKTRIAFDWGYDYSWVVKDYYPLIRRGHSKIHASDSIKKSILQDFYKSEFKYTITEQQLKTEPHLFDLAGTSYLLLINNDVPHLIFKDSSVLKVKHEELVIEDLDSLNTRNLYELINQRAILSIFNTEIPIKDKITPKSSFRLSKKVVTPQEGTTTFDNYYITYRGKFDGIYQSVEVPREGLFTQRDIDAQKFEDILIKSRRAREDFDLKKWEISNNRKFEDRDWSLRWQEHNLGYIQNILNIATGLVGTAAGSVNKGAGLMMVPGSVGSMIGGAFSWINYQNKTTGLNNQYEQLLAGRLTENYSLDIQHHRIEEDFKQSIDWMSSGINTPPATSRELIKNINKEIEATDIHIKFWTPTKEQLQLIYTYAKDNGVDCLIPGVTIKLTKDMVGVWQFTLIDGIESDDPMTVSYLKGLLTNGVKITKGDVNYEYGVEVKRLDTPIDAIKSLIDHIDTIRKIYRHLTTVSNKLDLKEEELVKCTKEKDTQLEKVAELANVIEAYKDDIQNVADLRTELALKEQEADKCSKDLEQAKEVIAKVRQEYNHKAEQLQQILHERNKLAEDKVALEDELSKRLTEYQINEKIKEETNKVWNQAIASSRITFRKNARLQSEISGCKQKLNELGVEIENYKARIKELEENRPILNIGEIKEGTLDAEKLFRCIQEVLDVFFRWIFRKMGVGSIDLLLASNFDPEHWSDRQMENNFIDQVPTNFASGFRRVFNLDESDIRINTVKTYQTILRTIQLTFKLINSNRFIEHMPDFFTGINTGWTSKPEYVNGEDKSGYIHANHTLQPLNLERAEGKLRDKSVIEPHDPRVQVAPVTEFTTLKGLFREYCFKDLPIKDKVEVIDVAPAVEKIEPDNEELIELRRNLQICNNNLNANREALEEARKQAEQFQNLSNLYKAEADNLRAEKEQAIRERDQARQELQREKDFFKTNPVTDAMIRADAALYTNARNVGKNWADMIKYLHEIKRMELTLIQNKRARQVPHGRTVRWLGDYLNYSIDLIVRIMRPYLGDNETRYAYSAKIPAATLNTIPDN